VQPVLWEYRTEPCHVVNNEQVLLLLLFYYILKYSYHVDHVSSDYDNNIPVLEVLRMIYIYISQVVQVPVKPHIINDCYRVVLAALYSIIY